MYKVKKTAKFNFHEIFVKSLTAEASTATVLRRTYEQYWKHSHIKTQILL